MSLLTHVYRRGGSRADVPWAETENLIHDDVPFPSQDAIETVDVCSDRARE